MKVIRFWGHLGNQMFIWCKYRQLQEEGYKVRADLNWGKNHPNMPFTLNKNFNLHPKKANLFQILWAKATKNYLSGYWQHEKYFKDIDPFKEFKFAQYTNNLNRPRIGVHYRGGDYIGHPKHDVDLRDYYWKARLLMTNKTNCYNFIDVSEESGNLPIHDMFRILDCDHQIIANSTFSWWAAYLNPNPDKIVIAPKKWFADGEEFETPEGWIRI
jgi:hypothetical protein